MGGGIITRKKEPLVTIKNLHYSFPKPTERNILKSISFSVFPQEFVSIVGPSGIGKTTLLRLLAGIVTPTKGTIDVAGLHPQQMRGKIGIMFQEYTAFPWLSIANNVRFGLNNPEHTPNSVEKKVKQLLDLVGLQEYHNQYPKHLSGGQRQRLALARTLGLQPSLLLLDEPFGALDMITREQLQQSLQDLYTQFQTTTILVTHDIEEALLLSDRIIVLGGNPARITAVLNNPFPRPRQELRITSEFQKYKHTIARMLE